MNDYNNHKNLINYIKNSIINYITEIVFTLDFMNIAVSLKSRPFHFLKELQKHITLKSSKKETHCKNPIWKKLFRYRYYFDLGDGNQVWVMAEKVRPLTHFDILIRLPHPVPSTLDRVETILGQMQTVRAFWVSKLEPTFDLITDSNEYREPLQTLLRQTLYLRHGRNAFRHGVKQGTDYINFRTSVKQTRIYQKSVDNNDGEGYDSLRFEIPIKRSKLFSENILKPTDIIKYDMRILEEIGFYSVDEISLKRSLLDYKSDHFFSRLIANFINKNGFHSAQLWARRIKECPCGCPLRSEISCTVHPVNGIVSDDKKFRVIQKCKHTKNIANFRQRYCKEIKPMGKLKAMMFTAFKDWKTKP